MCRGLLSPKVEREREIRVAFLGAQLEAARSVAHAHEAGETAAFRLVGVDGEGLGVEAARVRHVVLAAAQRAVYPGVDEIEHQRGMHADGGMQRGRRLPGAVAHARDVLSDVSGPSKRNGAAVTGDYVPLPAHPSRLYLQPPHAP